MARRSERRGVIPAIATVVGQECIIVVVQNVDRCREDVQKHAADSIIAARANNPKNKPNEKPKVPYGLYSKKAKELGAACPNLRITADNLQNKVRAKDEAANKQSLPLELPPVPPSAAALTDSVAVSNTAQQQPSSSALNTDI